MVLWLPTDGTTISTQSSRNLHGLRSKIERYTNCRNRWAIGGLKLPSFCLEGICLNFFTSPFSLFRQVHLGVGKSEYNPPFSGLRTASTWESVGFCGSHRQTDVLAKLSSWLGGWSPFCGDNGRHTAQVREWRSLRCRHLWVGG